MSGWRRRRAANTRRLAFACLACLAIAGCGSTPSFGPNIREVVDESQAAKRYGFVLVNVDAPVLQALGAVPRGNLRDVFPDDHRVVPRLGPGDVLSISVYESGAGELFAPPTAQQLSYGTSNATLPAVTVGPDGSITVPFASQIKVAGLTPLDVQDVIRRHLGGRSVQPQVLVSVNKDATNVVTVTGTVRNPGRYAITPASETLMQLIAEAGGATQQASDTVLQLTRHGRQVSVRLSDLLSFPQQDIHGEPADYINLVQAPRDFLVYGAVYKSGAYAMPTDNVTLTEAISHAGGMVDSVADSRGVFIFRYEYGEVLRHIPPAAIVSAPTPQQTGKGLLPVIYRIDMKTAAGIFYANAFRLRDKDLVFVPSAPSVDWEKYLDLLRITAGPALSAASDAIIVSHGF